MKKVSLEVTEVKTYTFEQFRRILTTDNYKSLGAGDRQNCISILNRELDSRNLQMFEGQGVSPVHVHGLMRYEYAIFLGIRDKFERIWFIGTDQTMAAEEVLDTLETLI